jgi:hypothetical protein
MAVPESTFNYEDNETKTGSIGALGATQHLTEKMHHQISSTSKVFVASNDSPPDGILKRFWLRSYCAPCVEQ